jgi:hypothetical protein
VVAPLAVKEILAPGQIEGVLGLTFIVKFDPTVTAKEEVPEQPDAFDTVTVYVPPVVTAIVWVDAVVDHK